ncbi:methylosome subunit pICln-like [Hydractinia symbiolongicarpus]|uniref:methylosome subunit pICln-like n=1 Tax=Hydractinia symbiolongicarpus TaxID=13093 RepID=UPI00254C1838|nr:methylosome subunit pICln-like [Hydractinia symbiolongicarpus]
MTMVSRTVCEVPTEGIVHTETNTKAFLGDKECGEGTLYITENVLIWKSSTEENGFKLQYPSISLHAVSRDTSSFPHECLFCLLESADAIESDERDPEPDVTEVRFVPSQSSNIKAMYEAVTYCQELHPDPDEEDSDEMIEEEEFFTSDNDPENIELSSEGQAVLHRLQQNMQIVTQEEFGEMVQEEGLTNGHSNGQFDDADEMN